MMFTDYNSTQKEYENNKNNEKDNRKVNQAVYFVNNPKDIESIIGKVKEKNIDFEKISIEKNTKAFDESIESVSSIKGIIVIMTYLIILRSYCNTFNDINIMDKRKNTWNSEYYFR